MLPYSQRCGPPFSADKSRIQRAAFRDGSLFSHNLPGVHKSKATTTVSFYRATKANGCYAHPQTRADIHNRQRGGTDRESTGSHPFVVIFYLFNTFSSHPPSLSLGPNPPPTSPSRSSIYTVTFPLNFNFSILSSCKSNEHVQAWSRFINTHDVTKPIIVTLDNMAELCASAHVQRRLRAPFCKNSKLFYSATRDKSKSNGSSTKYCSFNSLMPNSPIPMFRLVRGQVIQRQIAQDLEFNACSGVMIDLSIALVHYDSTYPIR